MKHSTGSRPDWFWTPAPNPDASLRMFCFPYAGGSELVFRPWARALPPQVELCAIQLPGRGKRMREAPFKQVVPLVGALVEAMAACLDKPYVFFGHSMGAILAFELARALHKVKGSVPAHLFASGRNAPHLPDKKPPTYMLPDADFLRELRRLNGSPPEVLEHRELMELLMPVLRADFELIQTYRCSDPTPLRCPITAFGGLEDDEMDVQSLEAWRDYASGAFRLKLFPGGHFFLQSSQDTLLAEISKDLRRLTA